MCLAIGPLQPAERGPLGHLWWQLAAEPLRLLGFAAAVHVLWLGARLLPPPAGGVPHGGLLLYAIGGLPLLGLAMRRLPQWSERAAIGYPAYTASFLAAFLGLGLLQIGEPAAGSGPALLLLAWLVGLRALAAYRPWIRRRYRRSARLLLGLLFAYLLGLLGWVGSTLA
ncbi:hypothetical protein QVG61_13050 [Thiohalobacter sp. IOR34]|uniref:hypothetical protein n=1 Tax=Thiohalobacter sp. IOR34 TaxID=3057176 RepID=UPI0025B12971|nr:hypothetical protein [Thiohalobacter sp. IOR34]WJW75398.1 hypothetical protein QVG61_13050 [Thiohalobacter sp. IOR34]